MDSGDVSDEYNDVSSLVSSEKIEIFSEDTDEETEEITGTSLVPYQFEPVEANTLTNTTSDTSSNTDQSEDESSSDEELLERLPKDLSW